MKTMNALCIITPKIIYKNKAIFTMKYQILQYQEKSLDHNIIYWQLKDYLGLGAGAHSFMKGIRFNNYYKPEKYIEAIEKHNSALEMQERVSIKDKQAEFCFLGLRLIKGISKHDFHTAFGIDIHEVYGEAIEKLKKLGLLDENRQYLKLTSMV